jgi:hypothetical protein
VLGIPFVPVGILPRVLFFHICDLVVYLCICVAFVSSLLQVWISSIICLPQIV